VSEDEASAVLSCTGAAEPFGNVADGGDTVRMIELGDRYLTIRGVAKFEVEVATHYRRASDARSDGGMNKLGTCSHFGRSLSNVEQYGRVAQMRIRRGELWPDCNTGCEVFVSTIVLACRGS
jgi:hypothetical protein